MPDESERKRAKDAQQIGAIIVRPGMVPLMDANGQVFEAKSVSDTDEADSPDGVGIIRAREILGELVNRAAFGNERIPIKRNGKQAAVLIGLRDWEKLRAMDAT